MDEYNTENLEHESWTIKSDSEADWAIRKIAEERAETERIEKIALDLIEETKNKIELAKKRCETNTSYLQSKLAEYFETVPHKATKTQEKYTLLSGSLVRKYGKPKAEYDDAELVNYLKKTGKTEYIKVKESPAWGEYAKQLSITDSGAIDTETGELVECIKVIPQADKFEVKTEV